MGEQLKTEQERLEMDDTSLIEELATLGSCESCDGNKDACEKCHKPEYVDYERPGETIAVACEEVINKKKIRVAYSTKLLPGELIGHAYSVAWEKVGKQMAIRHATIKTARKIYYDVNTNLEWLVRAECSGKDTTWDGTKRWVDCLGHDWRMPTIEEIDSLYDNPDIPYTGGLPVWSGENKEVDPLFAGTYYFDKGKRLVSWIPKSYFGSFQGFAARSRKIE